MIRQTVRSAALVAAGLLLANLAWGQGPVLRQGTSAVQSVALEYFGAAAGREILASKFDLDGDDANAVQARPYVGLTVADGPIAVGNVANITFTLAGATFSQTVSPANLDRRAAANCEGAPGALSVGIASGGAKGDSSVTFRVEATEALTTDATICFWVPDLQATLTTVSEPGVMPAVMGVNVTASIVQGVTNSSPFPAAVNGPDVDHDMNAATDDIPGPITMKTIFNTMPALSTSLGMGGTAEVSLADRSKIASGGTPDPSADPSMAAMGLSVGMLNVMAATGAATTIWKLDGSGRVASAEGVIDASLGGQVMLSVGGPFQDGDKVVFGSGSSARQVAPEGGMASTAVELKATTDMPIVYVPGGMGVLKPSKFAAMAKYSFNSLDNNSALPLKASMGEIRYAGLEMEGYAYGVVRGGGMEMSQVRATCHAPSGMCQVFADCTDQAGMAYFGGPVQIAAGATGVVDSDAIAEALGGGWDSGRGSCDIYSTANLSVQHMVRSGHGLINNSAVVGRSLNEDTSASDAIKAVVDNICASVGVGDPTNDPADGSGDTEVDSVCQPVDASPVAP